MEAYPAQYTEHNLPLVLLSGLGERLSDSGNEASIPRRESGTKLACNSPECEGERATGLLQHFHRLDGRDAPWNSQALSGPAGALKYYMKAIRRVGTAIAKALGLRNHKLTKQAYTLPPRKAAPLPQSASDEGIPAMPTKTELHSPLSPLSPGSPIFPDGLFTPLWVSKHQQQVPCLFLAFFDIAADDSSKDEAIKADINIIRTSLSRSGFKTRFAAVLLSDRSILQAPDMEERLSSIRRLTSLDSKTGLFFMPPMSSNAEISNFVQNIMTTLQPLCVEHYRELTKHARRKKARGGPPPSASVHMGAGSQSLSTSGWNVRYEFKQGVFAEIRQEMDIAERHYTAAIDELFSSEGIFEATASWSPRWEEARLLCDALAIRTLRCQLWVSQTTGAVQSWINYKDRMKDLVDRRGKGSETYGWAAWEARWAEVMAQLISRADLAVQRAPDGRADAEGASATMQFHMAPEKSYATTDRLRPYQMLHHSGYWLRLALYGARERQRRASAIPDEDRVPPGQSPASAVANRVRAYDTYLVSDPHEESKHDHLRDISRLSELASEQYEIKGQGRIMETLRFELAKDLANAKKYEEAKEVLLPLWESSSWRQEDWQAPFFELLVLLQTCADSRHLSDAELMVASTYELSSSPLSRRENASLKTCLDGFDSPSSDAISLKYHDRERLSPVSVSFAFESGESNVGETLECQITLASHIKLDSTLDLADVSLRFLSSRSVKIVADGSSPEKKASETVEELKDATETAGSLEGRANLSFHGAQSRTIAFPLALREAGSLLLTEASFSIRNDKFEIQHLFSEEAILPAKAMLVKTADQIQRRHLPRAETTALTVLPKPPKVKLVLHGLHKKYYTDECVRVDVEVINEEVDSVSGNIIADSRSEDGPAISLKWGDEPTAQHQPGDKLASTDLTSLRPSVTRTFQLRVQAPADPATVSLTIDVDYKLSADPSTPLRKTSTLDLSFVVPFEAHYHFGPVLYPGKWPSYFDPQNGTSHDDAGGIPQLWRLSSQVRSLAADDLVLHGMEIAKEHIHGDSVCHLRESQQTEKQNLPHGQTTDETFQLKTQKYSLEDRRPTTLESSLLVTWSREDDSTQFTTSLPVPRLTLPVSEPRVLCTLSDDPPSDIDATLRYHIENPSTHFLTFALTMEASEDFAFSGPKYRTLSLAPLSRHCVEYSLALYDDAVEAKESGRWIWPSLQVLDSYYQKSLKVHAAGPDVKMDNKGAIGVWIEL